MYQPEWRLRLMRSGQWRMEGKMGLCHDKLVTDGKVGQLKGICRRLLCRHQDAILRAQRYTERAVGRELGAAAGMTSSGASSMCCGVTAFVSAPSLMASVA